LEIWGKATVAMSAWGVEGILHRELSDEMGIITV